MVDSIDKSLPNTVEEVKDEEFKEKEVAIPGEGCLLYTSPSPRDGLLSRMPSSA